jgi:chromate transporter
LAGIGLFRDLKITKVTHVATKIPLKRLLVASALLGGAGLAVVYLVNPKLFSLSFLMFRINLFAFGGGLSALPLMHHEIVSRGWLESKAFMDGIALGQVTPGPISITGTFVGYLLFGVAGAVVATFATFVPSFLLLVASEPYFGKLKSSLNFARASKGIMSCFVGLLFYVTYKFARDIPWDLIRGGLVIGAFVALLRKMDVLLIVLVAAIYAIVLL